MTASPAPTDAATAGEAWKEAGNPRAPERGSTCLECSRYTRFLRKRIRVFGQTTLSRGNVVWRFVRKCQAAAAARAGQLRAWFRPVVLQVHVPPLVG